MTTVNKEEIQKFSKIADEWWDTKGKFKPLHMFNPTRIKYIKEKCIYHFKLKENNLKPLASLEILDIGCGGGLISEPMHRLGAKVTGMDASERNIAVAKLHAKKNGLNINYIKSSPEKNTIKKNFDVILNLEIIEHVQDVNLFLKSCSKMLNKGGIMFVATLNRTFESYIKAIVGAEYVLRWLPIGTHEWNKFVKPAELIEYAEKNSMRIKKIDGVVFNPINKTWDINTDKSVNYIALFKKT